MRKENIEIRFFFTKKTVKNVIELWKKECRRFYPYLFTDLYFTRNTRIAKIRKWKSYHRPRVELIYVERSRGLKSEAIYSIDNIDSSIRKLEKEGYKENTVIKKKKAWLITKKGEPAYAIEYIQGLGWTGEIEVPEKNKKLIPKYIRYLKSIGAKDFSKKSLLSLFIKK